MLDALFTEIEHSHTFEPAEDPLAIHAFEKRCGYDLPADLKEFYRRYRSVELFRARGESVYRFVTVEEIRITGLDIFGTYYEGDGPNSWYTICDVQDGNYIAVDLASKSDSQCHYIDCFHETYGIPGECEIIATSFAELLERCLRGGETLYYLKKGFQGYGDGMDAIQRIRVQQRIPGWLGNLIRASKRAQLQSGWQVHFMGSQGLQSKFFRDVDYGGTAKALVAAKQFWESQRRP